jgi:hypothetical protein
VLLGIVTFFCFVAILMAGFILREGRVNISERYSVYGTPAKAIGIIILSYLPLAGVLYALIRWSQWEVIRPGNEDLAPWAGVGLFVFALLICLLVAAVVAFLFAEDDHWWKKPPKQRRRRPPPRRRRRDEEEDDEVDDDRPRRRRR